MMRSEIEDFPVAVRDEEESTSREAAMHAAYEVQDEMDALCLEIKQLLAASYAIKTEQTMTIAPLPIKL